MTKTTDAGHDDFVDSLLGDFLDESGQLLDRLNENVLQLDEWVQTLADNAPLQPPTELLNDMFRSAHSLKGLSAMLGLHEINHLTHKLENVLDAARRNALAISGEAVELLFRSTDRLVCLVDSLRVNDAPTVDCDQVLAEIQSLLDAAGVDRAVTSQADADRFVEQELAALSSPPGTAECETTCLESKSDPECLTAPVARDDSNDDDLFARIPDEADIPARYLAMFVDETQLTLDRMTETLLSADQSTSLLVAEQLMILAHRVKGAAASIGLNRPARLAHAMEDLLQQLVARPTAWSDELAEVLLRCVDQLRRYLDGLRTGAGNADGFADSYRQLVVHQALLDQSVTSQPAEVAMHAFLDEPLRQRLLDEARHQATADMAGYVGWVELAKALPLSGLKARLVHEKLSQHGDIFFCHPSAEHLDDMETVEQLVFGLATDAAEKAIVQQATVAGVERVELSQLVPSAAVDDAAIPANGATRSHPVAANVIKASASDAATDSANRPVETVRVDIDRLDQLMNLAGELVINKARLGRVSERLKHAGINKRCAQSLSAAIKMVARLAQINTKSIAEHAPQAVLSEVATNARRALAHLESVYQLVTQAAGERHWLGDLDDALHQLDRVASGIQRSVMETRMVPIGPLFNRFRRVVRDISRTAGKDIRLEVFGEKTELDKRMIDELSDPLIHMVRNAADHGIESRDERLAIGKPSEGVITLNAFQRGNHIVIQVVDDGKGLDVERIRAKAIERELVRPADAEKLTNAQVFALIWEPGFSTAEKITEISGRGMGMDIVRAKIEELNGTVEIDSAVGVGTTLTIKLPLTLAIVPSLLVQIDGDVFALPIESVNELVQVPAADRLTVHGRPMARIRDRVAPVVELTELFGWPRPRHDWAAEQGPATLVILGSDASEIGVVVDELLGEEDVVIKSLAEHYRNLEGVAGASILGDGRVSLILDTPALMAMAARRPSSTLAYSKEPA